MADCDIILGGDDNGNTPVTVYRGTNVKDSPEFNTNSTKCFGETVTDGVDDVGGTLEIEKLSYDSKEEYIELNKKLLIMQSTPTLVTTVETITYKGEEPYEIRKNYFDCVIDGKDYESKPEEKSTRNLKFKYARMTEIVDDEEITVD